MKVIVVFNKKKIPCSKLPSQHATWSCPSWHLQKQRSNKSNSADESIAVSNQTRLCTWRASSSGTSRGGGTRNVLGRTWRRWSNRSSTTKSRHSLTKFTPKYNEPTLPCSYSRSTASRAYGPGLKNNNATGHRAGKPRRWCTGCVNRHVLSGRRCCRCCRRASRVTQASTLTQGQLSLSVCYINKKMRTSYQVLVERWLHLYTPRHQ